MSYPADGYTFDEVRSLIKLSKSGPIDTSPYFIMNWDVAADYGEIVNRHGEIVGQVSGLQLYNAGVRRK